MAKINAKVELAQLLDAATTHEAESPVAEPDLMNRMRTIVEQWPQASLDEQRTDLLADMRELLRLAVNDPTVVDTRWFERRAHRALCQDDGIIQPGEDFVRQYRMKTMSGAWSEWLTLPEDHTFSWPPKAQGHIRFAPAGKPFEDWERPSQHPDLRMPKPDGDRDAAADRQGA